MSVEGEMTREFSQVSRVEGNCIYLEGHPYPFKGIPTPERVRAINEIKQMFKFPWRWNTKKALKIIEPHRQPTKNLTPIAREIIKIIPNSIGELVAYVLEYDIAYRFRLQDLFSETDKETLSRRPIREILRLLAINKRRDYAGVHRKIRGAGVIAILALILPPFRKAFRRTLQTADFNELILDAGDRYWLKRRKDYKYDA